MSQTSVPSPFTAAANRLSRAHDATFFSLLNPEREPSCVSLGQGASARPSSCRISPAWNGRRSWLWSHSRAGDVIDETMQRDAVLAVARQQDPIDLAVRSLTAAQATVLRWILMHPGASPFAREATATMELNAGTVNSATKALMEAELIELFARNRFTATTPLRLLATLLPEAWGQT